LPPQWDIPLARRCAAELEEALRGDHSGRLFRAMYGNHPDLWAEELEGEERLRFITTHSRACACAIGPATAAEAQGAARQDAGERHPLVRGSRAAFGGGAHRVRTLVRPRLPRRRRRAGGSDTGCVWGGSLTARRLDVPAPPVSVPSTMPTMFSDS